MRKSQRLERADRRQPDPGVALADGDRASTASPSTGLSIVDGDPLEGVVGRLRAGRRWRRPTPRRRSGRGPRSGRGCPPARPSTVNSVLVVEVDRALLAVRQLDVAAERRERRGVLPDVEGRLDLGAQSPCASPSSSPSDERGRPARPAPTPARPARPRRRAGPSRTCRRAPSRTPAGPRSASQARASGGEADALEPERLRVAHAEQDDRGEQRRSGPRSGSRAVEPGTRAGGRGLSDVAEQPGDEAQQPRQHEQRAVAVDRRQRGQQVLPAEERLVDQRGQRARPRGTKAVSPTERRHSGPPSRKNTHGEDQRPARSSGQRSARRTRA